MIRAALGWLGEVWWDLRRRCDGDVCYCGPEYGPCENKESVEPPPDVSWTKTRHVRDKEPRQSLPKPPRCPAYWQRMRPITGNDLADAECWRCGTWHTKGKP